MSGMVASPTPMMPISSDSTSVSDTSFGFSSSRKRGGRHPSGGPATDDHNLLQRAFDMRDQKFVRTPSVIWRPTGLAV